MQCSLLSCIQGPDAKKPAQSIAKWVLSALLVAGVAATVLAVVAKSGGITPLSVIPHKTILLTSGALLTSITALGLSLTGFSRPPNPVEPPQAPAEPPSMPVEPSDAPGKPSTPPLIDNSSSESGSALEGMHQSTPAAVYPDEESVEAGRALPQNDNAGWTDAKDKQPLAKASSPRQNLPPSTLRAASPVQTANDDDFPSSSSSSAAAMLPQGGTASSSGSSPADSPPRGNSPEKSSEQTTGGRSDEDPKDLIPLLGQLHTGERPNELAQKLQLSDMQFFVLSERDVLYYEDNQWKLKSIPEDMQIGPLVEALTQQGFEKACLPLLGQDANQQAWMASKLFLKKTEFQNLPEYGTPGFGESVFYHENDAWKAQHFTDEKRLKDFVSLLSLSGRQLKTRVQPQTVASSSSLTDSVRPQNTTDDDQWDLSQSIFVPPKDVDFIPSKAPQKGEIPSMGQWVRGDLGFEFNKYRPGRNEYVVLTERLGDGRKVLYFDGLQWIGQRFPNRDAKNAFLEKLHPLEYTPFSPPSPPPEARPDLNNLKIFQRRLSRNHLQPRTWRVALHLENADGSQTIEIHKTDANSKLERLILDNDQELANEKQHLKGFKEVTLVRDANGTFIIEEVDSSQASAPDAKYFAGLFRNHATCQKMRETKPWALPSFTQAEKISDHPEATFAQEEKRGWALIPGKPCLSNSLSESGDFSHYQRQAQGVVHSQEISFVTGESFDLARLHLVLDRQDDTFAQQLQQIINTKMEQSDSSKTYRETVARAFDEAFQECMTSRPELQATCVLQTEAGLLVQNSGFGRAIVVKNGFETRLSAESPLLTFSDKNGNRLSSYLTGDFLVIGCSGLWNRATTKEVGEVIRSLKPWTTFTNPNLQRMARKLAQKAMAVDPEQGSVSVLVLQL